VYDREAAVSPLALPGAMDRCIELFSFAKSYQLGGFRLGFALGNTQAIAALEAVKVSLLCCSACLVACRLRSSAKLQCTGHYSGRRMT
jgi:aspartate/methionine/tyrosine aminotransferase